MDIALTCIVTAERIAYLARFKQVELTLTWRHSSRRLTHVGRAEAETLFLEPAPPLLLQLLLDLVDLFSKQVIVLSLAKRHRHKDTVYKQLWRY